MNFPCPLCKEMRAIKINKKSKPYLRCDDCGVLMFVNKPSGIRKIGKKDEKLFADDWFDNKVMKKRETLGSFFDSK